LIPPEATIISTLYNEKNVDSNDMHVTRPYKKIKRVMATKKVAKCQTRIDEEK
jgi:hypothetical protein